MILVNEKCVPSRSHDTPATEDDKAVWLPQLPGWDVKPADGIPELVKVFNFTAYIRALWFVNKLGVMAEDEDHHPTILLEWKKVTVRWSTHSIKNLHKNDFVMAAKTDKLFEALTAQDSDQ